MANKVFVGLSGGVDSAVSAALLQQKGLHVTGVFIKIWQPEFIECTWQRDRLDAMRVAAALGIPFREIDLSEEYKRDVVEAMLSAYRAGTTPNPDVLCNRSIKFGAFAQWAREHGADAVATGHYARVKKTADTCELLRGVDRDKDQSYFLHLLTQRDLARALFPIGEITKSQVRARAAALDLPVAQKHDSQGLCFVGDVSMPDFLRRFIEVQSGTVRDIGGKKIGRHHGAALYTIGQRHGFEVVGELARTPLYVTRIDAQANEITVSPDKSHAFHRAISIASMHWIGAAPDSAADFDVQTRYREDPVAASVIPVASGARVEFSEPHLVSPGQSLVVYEGDAVRGGGVIGFSAKHMQSDVRESAAA